MDTNKPTTSMLRLWLEAYGQWLPLLDPRKVEEEAKKRNSLSVPLHSREFEFRQVGESSFQVWRMY